MNPRKLNPLLLAAVVVLGGLVLQSHGLPQGCELPPIVDIIGKPPIAEPGLRILIVEEIQQRRQLPASQLAILTSGALRDFAGEKCAKVGGIPEFRVYDQNIDLEHESSIWKNAMKIERKSLPWLIVSNGRSGFSGPLPATIDDTMAIIRKYE